MADTELTEFVTSDLWYPSGRLAPLGDLFCLGRVTVISTAMGGVWTRGHSVELGFHFYSWMEADYLSPFYFSSTFPFKPDELRFKGQRMHFNNATRSHLVWVSALNWVLAEFHNKSEESSHDICCYFPANEPWVSATPSHAPYKSA